VRLPNVNFKKTFKQKNPAKVSSDILSGGFSTEGEKIERQG
jgi:hypothetical protein